MHFYKANVADKSFHCFLNRIVLLRAPNASSKGEIHTGTIGAEATWWEDIFSSSILFPVSLNPCHTDVTAMAAHKP